MEETIGSVKDNFKRLKRDLKQWGKEVFDKVKK